MRRGKSLVKRKVTTATDHEEDEEDILRVAQAMVTSRVVEPAPLDGFGEGAFISFGGDEGDDSDEDNMAISNSSLASHESSIDVDLPVGEGEGDEHQGAATGSPTQASRDVFKGAVFEEWPSRDIHHAHISLLCVKHPLTLRGPCAVYGLGGETSLDGYLLGSKHFILEHKGQTVCAQPVSKSRTKASEAVDHDHLEADPEALFGKVDWAWVKERLESWKRRLPTVPSIVLIVTPKSADRMLWYDRRDRNEAKSLPSFLAKRPSVQLEMPLLDAVRDCAQDRKGAVVVVGEQNIGKSTLGMAMANAFLSQHGRCYWLDLDLGQPSGSLPGSFSLCEVVCPIRGEATSEGCFRVVRSVYVGSSKILCPVSAGSALHTLLSSMLSPDGNEFYPLVVNTHGFVRSTGRRPTLEVIRRLRPTQVFHLCKPKGDGYNWLDAAAIHDPARGLNASIVPCRFLPSRLTEKLSPEAKGCGGYILRRDNLEPTKFGVEITETPVRHNTTLQERILGKKRGREVKEEAAETVVVAPAEGKVACVIRRFMIMRDVRPKFKNHQRRRDMWNRHFHPLKDGNESGESGAAVLTLNTKQLAFVAVFADETSAATRSTPEALADLLHGAVVGVGSLAKPPTLLKKPNALNTCLYTELNTAPLHRLFGLVTSAVADEDGSVTMFVAVRAQDLTPVEDGHHVGLVVGMDDRLDTAQALRWALKSH